MRLIATLLFLTIVHVLGAQVAVNETGASPDAGAILDIQSTDKGLLIPRTETAAITNPVEGMLIFQNSDKTFYYYKNGGWESLGGVSGGGTGEFTATGDLIYNAGNVDAQDLVFGRIERPGNVAISDKLLYYEQASGSLRGGELNNSAVWALGKLGDNSLGYGKNVEVGGNNSSALGVQMIVSGNSAFAMGVRDTVAGEIGAGALGEENYNGGDHGSIVLGRGNRNIDDSDEGAIVMGKNNIVLASEGSVTAGRSNLNGGAWGSVVMGLDNASIADSGAVTIGQGLVNNYKGAVVLGRYNAYSNYLNEPAFIVGSGIEPYDANEPRHDPFSILQNGNVGFNWNYGGDAVTVRTKGLKPREGIIIKGDTIGNEHVHLILQNNSGEGRGYSLVSTGAGSPIGEASFAIRDLQENKELLVIDSLQRVGIGTRTPDDALTVSTGDRTGAVGVTILGTEEVTESRLILDSRAKSGGRWSVASTGEGSDAGSDKFIVKGDAGDVRLAIDSEGKVGLGLADPLWDLHLKTTPGGAQGFLLDGDEATNRVAIRLVNNAFKGRTYSMSSSGGAAGVGRGKYMIRDEVAGVNRLVIDSTGNIGIGKDNPSQKLDVNGAVKLYQTDVAEPGTIEYRNGLFRGYNGSTWSHFGTGASMSWIGDSDDDTKVTTEEATDEDRIRMEIDGMSYLFVEKIGLSYPRIRLVNVDNNVVLGTGFTYSGDNNSVLIGSQAGIGHVGENDFNISIGDQAGKDAEGSHNIAIGANALQGSEAHQTLSEGGHVAIGHETLTNIDKGTFPAIGIGYQAGQLAESNGIFIGYQAGQIGSGVANTIIGDNTATGMTTAAYNLIIGHQIGNTLTTGNNNIFLGSTGTITGGDDNTFVGKNISTVSGNSSNTTALGYNTALTASNQIRLGQTSVSSIGGFANWSNVSDARFKRNVTEDIPGLDFVRLLRPVRYNLDVEGIYSFLGNTPEEKSQEHQDAVAAKAAEIHSGFIAQEVEAAAQSLGYDFSGVDAPKNDQDHYGLRYATFVVPLVKAVQEQQDMIEAQQETIDAQQAALAAQQAQLDALTQLVQSLQSKLD